jgi:hypothetical protein
VSKKEEDCPKFVPDDVCKARMDALDTKIKYLFGTSLVIIVLSLAQIFLQLVRGG